MQNVLPRGGHNDYTGKIDPSGRFLGVGMAQSREERSPLQVLSAFTIAPLLVWGLSSNLERVLLAEVLSAITILAFSLMIGLFYLNRAARILGKKGNLGRLAGWHKAVGYAAVPVLLAHPFFLVVPRFSEAGVSPGEAFFTIVTTFSSPGVLFGIASWLLLLALGFMSLFKRAIPLHHTAWRTAHGVLALLCLGCAVLHATDLGRHMDAAMKIFVLLMSAGGVCLLLKSYVAQLKREDT